MAPSPCCRHDRPRCICAAPAEQPDLLAMSDINLSGVVTAIYVMMALAVAGPVLLFAAVARCTRALPTRAAGANGGSVALPWAPPPAWRWA